MLTHNNDFVTLCFPHLQLTSTWRCAHYFSDICTFVIITSRLETRIARVFTLPNKNKNYCRSTSSEDFSLACSMFRINIAASIETVLSCLWQQQVSTALKLLGVCWFCSRCIKCDSRWWAELWNDFSKS